ncbi:MAG: hypothetical protein M1375_04935 [Candidatus Thermoplasmatota archaeon]|jgi:hypothetical protein|nr:hypothetical protein [Candidatus Thermoplasmatota archaeon]MCL5791298.1 hypothetical protein [Candidatus Thermoplasmatota archaeon]
MDNRRSNYKGKKPFRSKEDKRQPVPKKVKKLDMRKSEEFNFMLSRAIEDLPDSIRGSIAGGIYAAASRQGLNEAKTFLAKKGEEGLIDEKMQKQIWNLLNDYSTYR